MRRLLVMIPLLALAACDFPSLDSTPTAVDAATLPPLSGREQALLVGASGAEAQGNFAAAERDYLSAIGASTGHIDAHLALARLYEKQHQTSKEREVLAKALAYQPAHAEANYLLGKLNLATNDDQAALDAFNQGLKSAPSNIDLLSGAGIACDMLGQHVQAKNFYQRAITMNQGGADLSGIKTNLSMSYLLSGEPKRAIELLKPEVKKAGASPTTRHNLALAYGVLGNNTEARAVLRGELDEPTRQLSITRLKEYWADRSPQKNPLLTDLHKK